MRKFILSFALLCCCFNLALAQGPIAQALSPAEKEFNENINGAKRYIAKPELALEYYKRALKVAQTDVQKATAQLGIGTNTPFHAKGEADPKNENAARLFAFETVLALPESSAVQKHEARLALGEMQLGNEEFTAALATFETVSGDLNGSQPTQRGDAFLRAGEALIGLKRYEEARKRLNDFLATNTANPTDAIVVSAARKIVARQLIARSHLAQNNPRAALLELNKRIAADTKDADAATIYLSNGDFFRAEKQPALARASYQMVPALTNTTSAVNINAVMQIGATYFEEKNYDKAREIWNNLPEMRGAEDKIKADAWHSIGVAYYQEKNYDKAREAFGKWRDVADLPTKVKAWETIASLYLEEKKYAEARETLKGIGALGATLPILHDKAQLDLRQKIGTAQIYRAESNFPQAVVILKEVLTLTPNSNTQPLYYYEAHKQVKAAADEMAKVPASMDAAFSLYEAWETHYTSEFNKGEANMAMGDILAAQRKKEEAKAKYQRVIELRKNYDDAKIAQQKIDKLDGKTAN